MKKIDYNDIAKDNELRVAKLSYRQKESYEKLNKYLQAHEKNDINIYSAVALTTLEKGRTIPKDYAKYISHIKGSEQLRAEMRKIRDHDYEKYSIANLWGVFTTLMVLLFFKSWLTNHYLINYSLDILIAIVAFIFSVRSFITKYRLIDKYHFTKGFFYLDVGIVLVCFIIKFFVKSNVDITFLLLVATYFISQRGMKKLFKNVV